MDFILGILDNILANLVFWLLLGIFFWLISTTVSRNFSQFFGINSVRTIAVYLANLWTPASSLSKRPVGYIISMHELWAAQSVNKLFGSAPFRLPELVRGLVDALWLKNPVRCETLVSPLNPDDADLSRTSIVVGSSIRNSIRARYVQAAAPRAVLVGEEDEAQLQSWFDGSQRLRVWRGAGSSETSFKDINIFIVEKYFDAERSITVFFCFGPRADSSWMATEYLVRNWKRLAREFRSDDFVVCLGVPMNERYLESYVEPRRLDSARFERSRSSGR